MPKKPNALPINNASACNTLLQALFRHAYRTSRLPSQLMDICRVSTLGEKGIYSFFAMLKLS